MMKRTMTRLSQSGCPNCPRLTGNSFKSLRIVAAIWDTCPNAQVSQTAGHRAFEVHIMIVMLLPAADADDDHHRRHAGAGEFRNIKWA
jgi:hypothetical protein